MENEDDLPVLEVANDQHHSTGAKAPPEDLPLLTSSEDEDVYELRRPRKVSKAQEPAIKRTQATLAPAPSNTETAPRPKVWLWGVLGVGGVAAFVTVATIAIRYFGDEDAQKVAEKVRNHPLVLEKLGGIDECKMNFGASLNEGGKRTDVFDVRGPKGSGQFVTYELFYDYRSIKLRTAEGEWELLDGRENGVVPNQPVFPRKVESPPITNERPATPPSQPAPIEPARPSNVPQPSAGLGVPPQGTVIVQVTTPLKPGTPVFALHGATWHPAEVLAVSANRQIVVHWPHLGHNNKLRSTKKLTRAAA